MNENVQTLETELAWFTKLLNFRLGKSSKKEFSDEMPDLSGYNSVYAQFVSHYKFNVMERLAVILALVPHIKPQLLDVFYTTNKEYGRKVTEFGGNNGESHSGFLPTGETLVFLMGAEEMEMRFRIMELFEADHPLATHSILSLNAVKDGEPFLSGSMVLATDFIELFTLGKSSKPNFSTKFPASLLTTRMTWDDLVVDDSVKQETENILLWITHREKILNEWDLAKTIKPGYKALFYGPPGTGKTFTAALLGKRTGKDVYKIDLSMLVSKWVGETEKNLARVFDMAENKEWILFFDEADAIFGKRTDTQSSQERYANQEVAYLLQRTEDFTGTVILASNLKGNIDEAFSRRFQSFIYFPFPKPKQRLLMWENYVGASFDVLDDDISLEDIAKQYEISGAGIVNVLKYSAIQAAGRNEKKLMHDDVVEGIRRELLKEGKVM